MTPAPSEERSASNARSECPSCGKDDKLSDDSGESRYDAHHAEIAELRTNYDFEKAENALKWNLLKKAEAREAELRAEIEGDHRELAELIFHADRFKAERDELRALVSEMLQLADGAAKRMTPPPWSQAWMDRARRALRGGT